MLLAALPYHLRLHQGAVVMNLLALAQKQIPLESEVNHSSGHLIFDKCIKTIHWEENLVNKWFWQSWMSIFERMRLDPHLSSVTGLYCFVGSLPSSTLTYPYISLPTPQHQVEEKEGQRERGVLLSLDYFLLTRGIEFLGASLSFTVRTCNFFFSFLCT